MRVGQLPGITVGVGKTMLAQALGQLACRRGHTVVFTKTSRLRFACLPAPWRIADFDFSAQPGVDESLIRLVVTDVDESGSAPGDNARGR